MATIGTFTRTNETGSFTGAVKTLSINAKTTIKPADKANDRAPDYRILTGSAWSSGPPGRRPPAKVASISRSSSTIPASPPRSTPPWSKPTNPAPSI